ncbi:MAG: hypothetical protein IKW52_02545, partial [Alistipes sp.]|nr:hypothetical protein [Alistipes sp.]
MKHLLLLLTLALVACTQNEIDEYSANLQDIPETLTVGFEVDDTRIQLNEDIKTVWNEGDEVSVYYMSTQNSKWVFQGKTGDRTGLIKHSSGNIGEQSMDKTIIVYPYNSDYRYLRSSNTLKATLPNNITYRKDSYAVGENLMVATSEDTNIFALKSVCGWLKVQLTGNGEIVKTITLRGNNDEQVSGEIDVDVDNATIELADNSEESKYITLRCEEGVALSNKAISFFIALPPQIFSHGFTIEVDCEGYRPMTITTENAITIERNHIQPMNSVSFAGNIKDPIEVVEVGSDYFVFDINFPSEYTYFVVNKIYLTLYGSFETFLVGNSYMNEYKTLQGYHSIRCDFENIQSETPTPIEPDMTYVIVAFDASDSIYDANGKLKVLYTCEVTTKVLPQSYGNVDITLNNITSTSVDIKAVPDQTVSTYYLFIQDTETFTTNMDLYGQGVYMSIMTGKYTWSSTAMLERTWYDLTPSTSYTLMMLVVDYNGGASFSWQEFSTLEASGPPAELTAELVAAATDPHETLELVIKTNGASAKYAFSTTADVKIEREKGMTDADIAAYRGADLTAEQMTEATLTGTRIKLENLWPETEYTAIVNVLNEEKTVTTKTLTFKTPAKALPTRVESELFTSLIGEWEVTYNYMNYYYENKRIDGAVVKIAAGVDNYTSELYRSHNRLVILDWPYQDNWQTEDYTSFLPEHLMASDSYWAENPNLAYRDYGPKIFLEIAANGVVTVPTE